MTDRQKALLSKYTSRRNKLALLADSCGVDVCDWKWQGERFESRLMFQFEKGGEWRFAKSYDEDIRPGLKDR